MSEIQPTEITDLDHLNEFINKDTLTVLHFYATWFDIEAADDVGDEHKITSLPTVMMFRNGEMIEKVQNVWVLEENIKAKLAA
ncbi:hypothetical protein AA313_de0209753 [Arthrobotrys entomopaga]|nr:hypothetical protein AA313_de0209753 [Arthrobotrys entomopaga]